MQDGCTAEKVFKVRCQGQGQGEVGEILAILRRHNKRPYLCHRTSNKRNKIFSLRRISCILPKFGEHNRLKAETTVWVTQHKVTGFRTTSRLKRGYLTNETRCRLYKNILTARYALNNSRIKWTLVHKQLRADRISAHPLKVSAFSSFTRRSMCNVHCDGATLALSSSFAPPPSGRDYKFVGPWATNT